MQIEIDNYVIIVACEDVQIFAYPNEKVVFFINLHDLFIVK